jgi:erythromycin esterase
VRAPATLLRSFSLALAAAVGGVATVSTVTQQPAATDTVALVMGRAVERSLGSGERHVYRVRAPAGAHARIVVMQRGVDVVVEAFGRDGAKLAEVDSPNGTEGPEPVSVAVPSGDEVRVLVRPLEAGTSGRYDVTLVALLTAAEHEAELAATRVRHDSVVHWLRDHAVQLTTVAAGNGFADMAPLTRMIGPARVVALGEATHGTREFFQLKHRMLEYLVAEQGFTVFAIEATMPEGFDVNRYVLTGEGDPAAALAGLYFWTWDTEEVLAQIRWMRAWNADPRHTRKVTFYGFDMQAAPRAVRVVLDYLRRVDPPAVDVATALEPLRNPFMNEELERPQLEPLLVQVHALVEQLDRRRPDATARARDRDDWAMARQHARIVEQNLIMRLAGDRGGHERDRAMAENAQWILEREGRDAKMVLWAHNFHVGTESLPVGRPMGSYLRDALGARLVVFGFAFGRGGFQAMELPFGTGRGLTAFDVGRLADSTLDGTLGMTGMRFAAVDLRALPTGAVASWFAEPRITRSIGAGYATFAETNFLLPSVAPRAYDALLWIDSTSRARPNRARAPTPGRQPAPANLGFEEAGADGGPAGWWYDAGRLAPFGYSAGLATDNAAVGARCLELRGAAAPRYGETYGGATQTIDASAYRGKRVRVRGLVRTALAPTSEARLWARASAPQTPTPRLSRAVTAREWQAQDVVVDVPANAATLTIGFALVGEGRAWLDDVSVTVLP